MARRAIISLAILAIAAPMPAFAQAECARSLPASMANGQIVDVNGEVRIASAKGFVKADRGMLVGPGSQLLSGSFSQAQLQLSNGETVELGSDEKLTFAKSVNQPENVCLQVSSVTPQFEQGGEHAIAPALLNPLQIFRSKPSPSNGGPYSSAGGVGGGGGGAGAGGGSLWALGSFAAFGLGSIAASEAENNDPGNAITPTY